MSETATAQAEAPPRREGLRVYEPGLKYRADGDGPPTLFGHFAVFNEWTEIRSWEGHFMERFAPGAFTKTIQEGRDRMRVLFEHGHDATFGNKPLGPIRELHEDEIGAYYEVDLIDTSYNRDLVPMLDSKQLGASFRFEALRERVDSHPDASEHNPDGLEERTVVEARVPEFGPVAFPAYKSASAGVRAMPDDWFVRNIARSPELLQQITTYLAAHAATNEEEAPAPDDAAASTGSTSPVSRAATVSPTPITREEFLGWNS